MDSIKERFVFAESIIETVESITGAVSVASDEPPVIEINLGKAEGKYDYGGSAVALDMSWFARYKPMTDAVISAILWAFFIWRVYVLLPGIINGVSGTVGGYGTYTARMERIEKKGGK